MSSTRDPMRAEYPRRSTTALVWLVSMLVAAFLIQLVLASPKLGTQGAATLNFLALTIPALKDWHVWTLVTHALLSDAGLLPHSLFVIAGLILAGRELEPLLGARRFAAVFAGAVGLGGLAWAGVHWRYGGSHFGAGAGVYGFLVVLACIQPPDMALPLLPANFRLKHLVYALLAIDLLGLGFYEFHGAEVPFALSPSAHLGGMLAGWLYARFLHAPAGWDRSPDLSPSNWRQTAPGPRPAPIRAAPGGPRRPAAAVRAEVDLILDKINSQGFASLSEAEKRTLDEAKDLLSKH